MSKLICEICPHHCALALDEVGFCQARINQDSIIVAKNYGIISSLGLDPIEKKPLRNFFPGSQILSVGSFGCNLRCPFCQNYEISMATGNQLKTKKLGPEELVSLGVELKKQKNIGIAYTYNEPLVGYEYVRDCAILARQNNLKNVLVTNGYCCEAPLRAILPQIDALNIDLKAFTQQFYSKLKGDLATVKKTIEIAVEYAHVEVTTLIVPGENDSEEEIESLAKWLSSVGRDIPLHLTRFFPCYQMTDCQPTDIASINKLAEVARKYLRFVYVGNC